MVQVVVPYLLFLPIQYQEFIFPCSIPGYDPKSYAHQYDDMLTTMVANIIFANHCTNTWACQLLWPRGTILECISTRQKAGVRHNFWLWLYKYMSLPLFWPRVILFLSASGRVKLRSALCMNYGPQAGPRWSRLLEARGLREGYISFPSKNYSPLPFYAATRFQKRPWKFQCQYSP